jgi:hypothetical protein
MYPAYVTAGAAVAVARPEAFRWFVTRAPGSYTAALGFIMLAMGVTLRLDDFGALVRDRPLAVRWPPNRTPSPAHIRHKTLVFLRWTCFLSTSRV